MARAINQGAGRHLPVPCSRPRLSIADLRGSVSFDANPTCAEHYAPLIDRGALLRPRVRLQDHFELACQTDTPYENP